MQVVLIILSVGLLGFIIYLAVSPKSSRIMKIAALISMGLIALSVGICGFLIIKGPSKNTEEIILPVFKDTPVVPANKTSLAVIISFIVVFLFLIGFVIVVARRDRKKLVKPVEKAYKKPVFQSQELSHAELGDLENPQKTDADNEDNFDLGL